MNLDMEVNTYRVRDLMATEHEISFLAMMVYVAHHPTRFPIPEATMARHIPYISLWVDNWGREGDIALVAHQKDRLVGAACCRLFSAHDEVAGFLSSQVPILLLAVLPAYRGQGIGRCLLKALMLRTNEAGFSTLSLAVTAAHPALSLYEHTGFYRVQVSNYPLITMSASLLHVDSADIAGAMLPR